MAYQPSLIGNVSLDAGGRLRIGQLTTLGDIKSINYYDTSIVELSGTGTLSYGDNNFTMSVAAGEYGIFRTKQYFPYFSGKSQVVEETFDNFQTEANVTKRVGYFSSLSSAPYDSDKDGFWLEDDGTTKRIIVSNTGTETYNNPMSSWNGEEYAKTWFENNSQNFNVILWDFLWLGGAILRLFVKTDRGFTLANTFHYSGTSKGTMCRSPNQCIRYEIRSSTGEGIFNPICAQVSTEGSINESGKQKSFPLFAVSHSLTNSALTYPIVGIRKKAGFDDNVIKVFGTSGFVTTANDNLYITLHLNPTLSAPLTYSEVSESAVEYANGNGTITMTDPGKVLYSAYLAQGSILPTNLLAEDFLSYLGTTLDGESDEIVLCGRPISGSMTCYGMLNIKEYS